MAIVAETCMVYRATTKRRRYLSARAAAFGEARRMMDDKYPPEKAEYENGRLTSPSWHWSEDERLEAVYARMARRILSSFRRSSQQAKGADHA